MRCVLSCLLMLFSFAAVAQTPASFKSTQTDSYYSKLVHDPYRMLEDTSNAVVKEWMRKEAAQTETFFASMPGYKKLQQNMDSLLKNAKEDWVQKVAYHKGKYYVVKVMPGDDVPNLYEIDQAGKSKRLVNPQKDFPTIASKNISITDVQVSPHGNVLGYSLAVGGYEWDPRLVMRDLKTGRQVFDTLYQRMGTVIAGFDPETPNGFYFIRFPRFHDKSIDPIHWFDSSTIAYHVIGSDPSTDKLIIGTDTTVIKRKMDEDVYLTIEPGMPYALAMVKNKVASEYRIYTAPASTLKSGSIPWKQITDWSDAISAYAVKEHWLYVQENKGTGRVLRIDLRNPSLATATEVVPRTKQIVDAIAVTKNELLVTVLDAGAGKLLRIPHGSAASQTLSLPTPGKVRIVWSNSNEPDFIAGITSYVRPFTLYNYNASTKRFVLSPVQQYHNTSLAPLVVKEVNVKSHDGVMVPMTIVHKKGLKLDGTHPVSLRAYGAYGMQDEPSYWPEDMDWFNRGGIRAIAHVRGGGVYGEEWHRAGQKTTKTNTWKDVIACAEWLHANKYATAKTLVGSGTSAGGITMGRSLTERPDLFSGVFLNVGCLDMVRAETAPNGDSNIPEFGTVKTEEGFHALYAMSTYHHVKPGTAYPAVMLTHGVNDNRVPVWHSLKTAMKLREANTSTEPILLRLDFDSGHGAQLTMTEVARQVAQNMAFYYWRAGFPEFQPKKGF